jgi:hypothetical protein
MSPRVRRLIAFHSVRSLSAFQMNEGGSTNPGGRGAGMRMKTRNSGSSILGLSQRLRVTMVINNHKLAAQSTGFWNSGIIG